MAPLSWRSPAPTTTTVHSLFQTSFCGGIPPPPKKKNYNFPHRLANCMLCIFFRPVWLLQLVTETYRPMKNLELFVISVFV